MGYSLQWIPLSSLDQFQGIVEGSQNKPALIFKHRNSSTESQEAKDKLEAEWTIPDDQLDCFIVDVMENKVVATEVSDFAGVPNSFPQVLLFADGVAMYDESHDMINIKKIKIALKIINRTFRWLETRV